jgi:hypothetical protein
MTNNTYILQVILIIPKTKAYDQTPFVNYLASDHC